MVTSTVATLPSVMPKYAVVLEPPEPPAPPPSKLTDLAASSRGSSAASPGAKMQLKSVVLFTIEPRDGVAEVTAFSHKSLSDYCVRWGCHTHFFLSRYAATRRSANFERYQAFLELFDDKQFKEATTFIYVECGAAIVRPSVDISLYAPRNGSAFDVLFGNMGNAQKVGRPSTAFIAARRSGTALNMFERLAKVDCGDQCSVTRRPSTEKFDECCVNMLSVGFQGKVACISERTPLQAFSSEAYAKLAADVLLQPPVLQCAHHACAEHRAVVEPGGAAKCNWRETPKVCAATTTLHAMREVSARETWQSCSTYTYGGSKCAAPDSSPEDIAQNSFTIVVSTFARDDILLSNLPHWLACNNVSEVLVVWHNPKRDVIPKLRRLEQVYSRLTVLQQTTDRLSNRYLEGYRFKTEAVFSVDDDEWYSSAILHTAFQVWKQHSGEAMVGFSPRHINYAVGSEREHSGMGYVHNGVCKHDLRGGKGTPCGHYNTLFVTKGGFLHTRFYKAYFTPAWDKPRAAVDEWSTAEDILMAAVHASLASPSLSAAAVAAAAPRSSKDAPPPTKAAIIAVTARSRHASDYYGTLTLAELEEQTESLKRDPNSLRFWSESKRGKVRMVIVQSIVEQREEGVLPPQEHSVWYSAEAGTYITAAQVCANSGASCFII